MSKLNNSTAKPLPIPLGPVMLDVLGLELTDDDRQRLLHPSAGAVILFARNYDNKQQVTDLISEIKALRSPSLLIAVDQEGGRVQRFKDGFTILPPAKSFGELWNEDKHTAPMKAFESAKVMASELLEVGVDFSFAPVFDVETTESDVIGDRSFHNDPKVATELLGAYIDGMHSAGMVAIAKHFPGHGGVSGDSHHCLPEDSRGIRFWIKEMLRDDLGFEGVVFSDDLTMAGAEESSSDSAKETIVESAERSINAGCDMVLVCNSPEKADQLLAGLEFTPDDRLSYRLNRLRSKTF